MESQQECPRRTAENEGQHERGRQALRILNADLEGPSGGWGRMYRSGGGVVGILKEN